MKKLLYVPLIITLLISCQKKVDQLPKETAKHEPLNPSSDPKHFVGKHKAKAMVLGVFHFSNPGLDSYKRRFPFSILEDKRQAELNTLLGKIEKYRPTKILLECSRVKSDSIINGQFQNYLNGTFGIRQKRNEVYQIAFKLAKKLGHDHVYCSDASAKWFGAALDWDNYDEDAHLKKLGQYEKATRYDYAPFYQRYDSLKTVQSLTEHLMTINDPKNRLKDHQAYLTATILTGAGDNYLGADSVGKWYRRNLRIFSNAYDLTDFNQEERLLLIYGSGHVWQLRQLFTDSPDFDYIEVNDYLKP